MTRLTPNFNAITWLESEGYDVKINDITNTHTLAKEGVVIKIQGEWSRWTTHLHKDYVNSWVFPNMHYATSLDPGLIFNLDDTRGWQDILKNTERQWLSEPNNLLRRVLEKADIPPQKKPQSVTNILRCEGVPIPVYYTLNTVWNTHAKGLNTIPKLQVEAKYVDPGKIIKRKTPYSKAIITGATNIHLTGIFTAEQVLDIAGVPHGVESLIGDTWSDEWWHNLGKIARIRLPAITTYAVPPDADLMMP